jgi:hypothetical protein
LPKDKAKCVLWDDLGDRTEKELLEAREKAKAELRAKGIEVDDSMGTSTGPPVLCACDLTDESAPASASQTSPYRIGRRSRPLKWRGPL